MIFVGEIIAPYDQFRDFVNRGGVYITKQAYLFDGFTTFGVELTESAMDRLDPYWGEFIWSLEPKDRDLNIKFY